MRIRGQKFWPDLNHSARLVQRQGHVYHHPRNHASAVLLPPSFLLFLSFFISFFRDIYHDIRGNGDGKGTDPCNVRDFETFRELGLVASLSKLVSVIRWRATASSFASLIGRSSRIRGMSRKVRSAGVVEAGRGKFYVQT